jgi:hypothetical protein
VSGVPVALPTHKHQPGAGGPSALEVTLVVVAIPLELESAVLEVGVIHELLELELNTRIMVKHPRLQSIRTTGDRDALRD